MAKTVRIVKPQLMPVTSSDPKVLQQTLNRLVEAVQPLVGQNANKLETAITFADLNDSGFSVDAFLSGADGGAISAPVPNVPDPVNPLKVKNFSVSSTWDTAILTWDAAGYKRHAFVEVWRAVGYQDEDNSVPSTLAHAVYIGQSPTTGMLDSIVSNHYYRYWVRNVSQDGLFSEWHSEEGTVAFAPRSPSDYISIISGEIKRDDLYIDLGTEIDRIAIIGEQVEGNTANIVTQSSQISTLNSATASLTQQISAVSNVAGSASQQASYNSAVITTQATAIATLNSASATLTTQVASNLAVIQQNFSVTQAQGALINASYTVKIDTGKVITGFGLMTDATGFSRFGIRADRFYVAPPSKSLAELTDDDIPFIINGNDTLIKNAYIDTAYIETLVTGNLIANKITGATITGVHLRGGDLSIGNNFTVDGYGNLTAVNGYFHGNIQANTGVLNNVTIKENCTVLGTVYANKIVGDVVSAKLKPVAAASVVKSQGWASIFSCSYEVSPLGIPRSVFLTGLTVKGSAETAYNAEPALIGVRVLVNGSVKSTTYFRCVYSYGVDSGDEGGRSNVYYIGESSVSGGAFVGTAAGNISVQICVALSSNLAGSRATAFVDAHDILVQLLPIGEGIL